jgi:hypothetical protein
LKAAVAAAAAAAALVVVAAATSHTALERNTDADLPSSQLSELHDL